MAWRRRQERGGRAQPAVARLAGPGMARAGRARLATLGAALASLRAGLATAARLAGPGAALLMAGGATAAAAEADGPSAAIARLLAGDFDNAAQVAQRPPGVADAPAPGRPWLDRQRARHLPVTIAALPGHSLYLEWRAADGRVTRQRLWRLRDTPAGPRMAFHAFRNPGPLVGGDTARLAGLGPADLISYPEACDVVFRAEGGGWTGRIDPADCRITAQSGRTMALDVTMHINAAGLGYRERGVLPDGSDAFLVPGHDSYRFERLAGAP